MKNINQVIKSISKESHLGIYDTDIVHDAVHMIAKGKEGVCFSNFQKTAILKILKNLEISVGKTTTESNGWTTFTA